ncbi:helix-turn-helix transcriptional regulator [Arthrobacter subterraneus]|uniref:helix-turn-helix transcriptional regulator n=1 Tax=Arthrobacter subterraneus TaxID=335973 RepID=UPI0037FA7039
MSTEHPGPRFLTIKDVAAELTTSESQIRALISCGDLPAIQIGGRGYLKFRPVSAE